MKPRDTDAVTPLPGYPPETLEPVVPMPHGACRTLGLLWMSRWRALGGAAAACAVAAALLLASAGTGEEPSEEDRPRVALAEDAAPILRVVTAPPESVPQAAKKDRVAPQAVGSRVRIVPPEAFAKRTPEDVSSAFDSLESTIDGIASDLEAGFEIRIASDLSSESGFWRTSEGETQHFVVVEAFRPDGKLAEWEVEDMDTGAVRRVSRWAVRVTEDEFTRLASEKAVSGRVSEFVAGRKVAGSPDVSWRLDAPGGALLEWEGMQR